ncbi:MAG: tryptophan--tRNA ligase, partial [Eubacteriales bacterium]
LNAFISMDDDTDAIMRKFKRAVTDSGSEIRRGADKPGITNLLNIYSLFADKSVEDAEREFEGAGYADFKLRVGEAVAAGI